MGADDVARPRPTVADAETEVGRLAETDGRRRMGVVDLSGIKPVDGVYKTLSPNLAGPQEAVGRPWPCRPVATYSGLFRSRFAVGTCRA